MMLSQTALLIWAFNGWFKAGWVSLQVDKLSHIKNLKMQSLDLYTHHTGPILFISAGKLASIFF